MARPLLLILCLTSLLLGGCAPGEESQAAKIASDAPAPVNSRSLMPEDPHIKTLYIQSCYGCHSSGAGKAPRTGQTVEWEPRWAQGMDTLLQHTRNGMGSMPPKGMCMNCSDEDFAALIRFMADKQ